jgi:phospholipase C
VKPPACALAASFALAACGGGGGSSPLPANSSPYHGPDSGTMPIKHIVLMIQENRTFNNLFATFPGAIGATTGEELVEQSGTYDKEPIKLSETSLENHENPNHYYPAFLTAYQNGAMDGFNLIKFTANQQPEGKVPYQYVNPKDVQPYWSIAEQWGLADELFQTQGSDSFTAHQDLIRGGTFIDSTQSLIDLPTTSYAWGCDSGPHAKTTLITTKLQYLKDKGPFPCSNKFPDYGSGGYETLRDLLDAKSVSWKYYTPVFEKEPPNGLWNAFDVIAPVRYGSEWKTNISSPETNIFSDITNGTLPAMSWVIPDAQNSDHPAFSLKDTGPSWVADIVNAIGQSNYWDSTVVIVVWDDWGGFYDPVAPPLPRDDQGGPGFRVPMLVVSPYLKIGKGSQGGYISNTVYEFGSIVRFIENTWHLGRLGTTDASCKSIGDMFDFSQSPRKFKAIPSTYDKAFFLHQSPSSLPLDSD